MSKDDAIKTEGIVRDVLPGTMFRVELPNGSLVMLPTTVLPRLKEAPDTEFNVNSGADQVAAQVRSGVIPGQGGCPILQNTPCLHATPGMRSATGNN